MTTNPPVLISSCAVRGTIDPVDGPVFAPIDGAGHRPFGVDHITAMPYGFRLYHAQLDALGDAQVSSDETLGDLDIEARASWALDHVDVTFWRAGAKVAASSTCVPYANVWVHLTGYPLPS